MTCSPRTASTCGSGGSAAAGFLNHRPRPALLGGLESLARRTGQLDRIRTDINLFFEHIRPEFLPLAHRNVSLPNPEWFDRDDQTHLASIDLVLAKTRHAVPIFEKRGSRVGYVGFTSEDRYAAGVARRDRFLHVAGQSRTKGTERLIALWTRHPSWPPLWIIQSRASQFHYHAPAPSIEYLTRYLPDAELQQLQNECRFHLCPSETEGFGHALVEALSVGAVTITLDAEPMNELVRPERGVLVSAVESGRLNLATTYRFDDDALVAAIEQAPALSERERAALGEAVRGWFQTNDRMFRARFADELRTAL